MTPLLSTLSPEAAVDIAVQHLSTDGVKLVEWRAVLYRKMQVPIIPKNFSYIVDDNVIDRASDALNKLGLPLCIADPFLIAVEGDLYSKAILHRLTESTNIGAVRYIALYPSSFVSFNPSDLETSTYCNHIKPEELDISPIDVFIPRPSAAFASLFRLLLQYPKGTATRSIIQSDLAMLIRYHLYHETHLKCSDYGNKEPSGERQDVANAVALVRVWSIEGQWRKGEEWMGDALASLVAGTGEIVWLP